MEQQIRSIAKSVVWRLVATANGFIVAYLFLGSLRQSLNISVVANVTGMVLYYVHERMWNKINWKREATK